MRFKVKVEVRTKVKINVKGSGRGRPLHARPHQQATRGAGGDDVYVKAAQKGFATAKPYGDSRRYDFILDVGQRLWRVQVKSSSAKQYGSYMVNLQRNANGEVVPYDASEIDFVVAYVMPCDAWFVIPVEAIYGRQSAKLCLHGNARSGRLGKYWEAWGLMTMRWAESG